jgi:hypothetical protein
MKEHAKKALKHDTKVLGKTVPTMLIIGLFLVGGGSAALLSTFGTVTGEADVEQSVKVEGPETVSYQGGFVAGATRIDTFNVTNDATQSAGVTYSTECSATIEVSDDRLQTDSSNCDGVNRRAVAYYDSAGADFTGYSSTNSPDLEVGEDKEYGSIGAAVADASSDQTILVHGGDYDPFTVNKSGLKVVAANAPNSDASGSEGSVDVRGAPNGIEVTEEASGATVKGFNIDVSKEKETDSRGILVKASEVTVDSNYVNGVRAEDRAIGIYLYGHHSNSHDYNVDDTTVINNKVEDVKASGLTADDASGPSRAEGITITENGSEGDANSADSVTLTGNTITNVGETNPGISAAIEVDGGNAQNFVIKYNEISDIEHQDAPGYPYDLGIYVTGYGGDSVGSNTVVEKNNFLMSTSGDVDVASDTSLDASDNWFGENGIQVSPNVTESYEEVTSETLSAGETDTVGIFTNFDVALAPGDYTVDFDVSPQSAS